MSKLSDRVLEIRRELDISGVEFGDIIGISKSAVSKLELGKSMNLKLDHLYTLSDSTSYSAEWIAIGRGKKRVVPPDLIIDLTDYSKENRELILQLISHIPKNK